MKWKRQATGVYTSGLYTVERWTVSGVTGWYVSGPGLDESHETKKEAQEAAVRASENATLKGQNA